jgi:hypothetical protein
MAVKKRGKKWHLKMRIFGKEVGVATSAKLKSEAERIEMAILTACRGGDYRGLDPVSREVCVRIFQNQGWKIPTDLGIGESVAEELTLWKAMELCLKYPRCPEQHESRETRIPLSTWSKSGGRTFP